MKPGNDGPGMGIPLGFVKGLGGIVVRELVGVYEFVSSPFPLPAGYRPLIQPEFPWSYFDERGEVAQREGSGAAKPAARGVTSSWGAPTASAAER